MTIKTKIRALYPVFLLVAVWLFAAPHTVSAYTTVRMKQYIRPIPCGVDHLTDADGVDHYFVARQCGTLVAPPSTSLEESTTSGTSPGGQITGTMPVYIETKDHTIGDNAYLVLAKKGQVYTFRLDGDSELSPLRTFEVAKVSDKNATLLFTPGDKEATLPIGGKIDADIAFGSDPDISVRVKDISDAGLVSMQIWFPLQCTMQCAVKDTINLNLAIGTIGAFVGLAGVLHVHSRRRL